MKNLINSLLAEFDLILVWEEKEEYLGNGEFVWSSQWRIGPRSFIVQELGPIPLIERGIPHEILCGTWVTL